MCSRDDDPTMHDFDPTSPPEPIFTVIEVPNDPRMDPVFQTVTKADAGLTTAVLDLATEHGYFTYRMPGSAIIVVRGNLSTLQDALSAR